MRRAVATIAAAVLAALAAAPSLAQPGTPGAGAGVAPAAESSEARQGATVRAPASPDIITHLLSRATYGPRPGDVARAEALGAAAWLERQLHPERIDDPLAEERLRDLRTLGLSVPELFREYPAPDRAMREQMQSGDMSRRELMQRYPPERRPQRIVHELAAARLVRAVASERQLQEVMVDFWFNHFNVFAFKNAVRWYVTDYERTVIRPHAPWPPSPVTSATA
jgi:uncharacterized protein (DUF1800 family)